MSLHSLFTALPIKQTMLILATKFSNFHAVSPDVVTRFTSSCEEFSSSSFTAFEQFQAKKYALSNFVTLCSIYKVKDRPTRIYLCLSINVIKVVWGKYMYVSWLSHPVRI